MGLADILGVDLAEALGDGGEDGHGCARELRFDCENEGLEEGSEEEGLEEEGRYGSDGEVVVEEEVVEDDVVRDVVVEGSRVTTTLRKRVMVRTVFGEKKEIPPPVVGMVFDSWDDVDSYFNRYIKVKKELGDGKCCKQRRNATWTCECYGQPSGKRKLDPLWDRLEQDEETVIKRKTKSADVV
uniref:Uncharacterized protein n=1 Tax=Chenopodium quinoa TaxID=63459 RepID=A0A803N0B3_CHEQI